MDALPGIGSVCSGGRYDNLAELYTAQELPGIGASLGLDRLLAAMEELGMIEKVSTPAPVFIPFFDAARLHDYLRLAAALRAAGIGVEVFPEAKKLGQQLKYADRRGFRVALIAGQNEFDAGVCQIKDLRGPSSRTCRWRDDAAAVIEAVKGILGGVSDSVPSPFGRGWPRSGRVRAELAKGAALMRRRPTKPLDYGGIRWVAELRSVNRSLIRSIRRLNQTRKSTLGG